MADRPEPPTEEFEVEFTIKIKGSGNHDQVLDLLGEARRFVKLTILPNAEIIRARYTRPDWKSGKHVPVDPAKIPIKKK
jgi:hypothetical protein